MLSQIATHDFAFLLHTESPVVKGLRTAEICVSPAAGYLLHNASPAGDPAGKESNLIQTGRSYLRQMATVASSLAMTAL